MAKAKKKAKRRKKKTARKALRQKKRKLKRRSLAISKAQFKKSSPVKSAQKEKPRKPRPSQAEEESEAGNEVTLDKTPMRIYLTQIEKIPLLTPEEEVKLAKKIQAEDPGESREAREKMIRSNLRLVISIAKRYANRGLPFSPSLKKEALYWRNAWGLRSPSVTPI